jgi:ATP-dependent RNA helicase DDX3X
LEDYIHRIGRTGRVGNQGTAISLINEEDRAIVKPLYNFFKKVKQDIPSWFDELYTKFKEYQTSITT